MVCDPYLRNCLATAPQGGMYPCGTLLVTEPGGLSSSSIIPCTPQDSTGSGVYVRYALRDSNTKFRIPLTKECTSSV